MFKNIAINYFKKISFIEVKYKIISRLSLLVLFFITAQLRESRLKDVETIANLKSEILALKKNIINFNLGFEAMPFPVWQKKKNGDEFVLQYVNPLYVKTFGFAFNYDRYSIIGNNNFELGYPLKVAQRYYENDVAVAVFGNVLDTKELFIDENGVHWILKVKKWRELYKQDTLVNGLIYEVLKDE